jgi:hypothetical protein
MDSHDKQSEMVWRYVLEAQQRVTRQELLIAHLVKKGCDTAPAEEVLELFEKSSLPCEST